MGYLKQFAGPIIWIAPLMFLIEVLSHLFRPRRRSARLVNRLAVIEVLEAEGEPVNAITKEGCILEGFPKMEPEEFVKFFCEFNKCKPDQMITRIRFGYCY